MGGGPRGLAVVERTLDRLAHSNDREETPVLVWFDDSSFGSGKVWNPYQTTALLMNTVASQLSGFPDSSAGIEGRYLEGPTFYEWLKSEKASAFLHSDLSFWKRLCKRVQTPIHPGLSMALIFTGKLLR